MKLKEVFYMLGLRPKTRPFIRAEVFKHLKREQRDRLLDSVACHGYTIHRLNSQYDYRGDVLGREGMVESDTFDIFATPES